MGDKGQYFKYLKVFKIHISSNKWLAKSVEKGIKGGYTATP